MTISPTEPYLSLGQGDGCAPISVAVLDSDVCRNPRPCFKCGGPQTFVEVYEIPGVGRLGFCFGCGEERVIRFTRGSE